MNVIMIILRISQERGPKMKNKWFRKLLRHRVYGILILLIQIAFLVFTLISTSKISKLLRIILNFISLLVVLHVVSKKEKGGFKLMWVFTILIFPIFGGLMYLIVHYQTSSAKLSHRAVETEAKAKKYMKINGTAFENAAEHIPLQLPQMRYLQNFAGFPIYDGTESKFLPLGEMKHEYLLRELEKAEKYIFLEYFLIQEGVMWDSILEILKRKVKEGVLVRLIYDDIGCFFLLPKDYNKALESYGIECAIFNKFKPLLTSVHNTRDHRKIVSIDGKVCFTGGINLSDEYINVVQKHGHWKDCAIMLSGKAVWSFTLMFLHIWEVCTDTNEDYMKYYPEKCQQIESDGFVQPYADSPLDTENVGEHVYIQIINNARDYVYINTPYLIIDDSMVSALTLAAKRGVDVRIVTPHRWDKFFVHMTTRSYYRELIHAGVKIYEYSKGFIHAKTFVSDDITATVGTTNLDFRSLYLHFECGVQLYNTGSVADIKNDYLKTLKCCTEITMEDCRYNFFVRLFQDILRLFAPLM